jgi:hypothetical protein
MWERVSYRYVDLLLIARDIWSAITRTFSTTMCGRASYRYADLLLIARDIWSAITRPFSTTRTAYEGASRASRASLRVFCVSSLHFDDLYLYQLKEVKVGAELTETS